MMENLLISRPNSSLILSPEALLKKEIHKKVNKLNALYRQTPQYYNHFFINEVKLTNHNPDATKGILGAGLVAIGQPIIKKIFVMKGAITGTSIASKYLRQLLPQILPIRVLSTNVLGGRATHMWDGH